MWPWSCQRFLGGAVADHEPELGASVHKVRMEVALPHPKTLALPIKVVWGRRDSLTSSNNATETAANVPTAAPHSFQFPQTGWPKSTRNLQSTKNSTANGVMAPESRSYGEGQSRPSSPKAVAGGKVAASGVGWPSNVGLL